MLRGELLLACAIYVSPRALVSSISLISVDVFNRHPDATEPRSTIHIMKYIFPMQFGLHNVFTSTVDPKETVQPFKDYTLREQEIAQSERNKHDLLSRRIPRRLRGEAFRLVRKLQVCHHRCSYHQMLSHYCPLKASDAMLSLRLFNTD